MNIYMIYCVVGVEYNSMNMPISVCILKSFTNVDDAVKYRDKQNKYTTIDIIETEVDKDNDINVENELNFN